MKYNLVRDSRWVKSFNKHKLNLILNMIPSEATTLRNRLFTILLY